MGVSDGDGIINLWPSCGTLSAFIPIFSSLQETLWAGYEEGGIESNGNYGIDMWDDGDPGVDPTNNLLCTYYYAAEPDVSYR